MRSVSRAGCVELYSDLQRAPERSTSLSSWLSALHSTPSTPSLSVWANTRSSVDRVLNANLSVPGLCTRPKPPCHGSLSHPRFSCFVARKIHNRRRLAHAASLGGNTPFDSHCSLILGSLRRLARLPPLSASPSPLLAANPLANALCV